MRAQFEKRIAKLIARLGAGERDDDARDALLRDLDAWQQQHIAPLSRLRKVRPGAALPTDVFRFSRVAAHEASADVRVFQSSGTTHGARSAHAFADLTLYDAAAQAWASTMLFCDAPRRLVVLAPPENESPDSSLSYMLARFGEWFGDITYVWKDGALDVPALQRALGSRQSVTLLGTSFALVHADERSSERFALPPGSCIMQTGGFKGRSREVSPAEMLTMLSARFGVPPERVIAEYGMTELSSQAYETLLVEPDQARRLRFPGWVRTSVVDPETLEPTEGEGLLRIDDAANLDSVCAVQTADLAREVDGGFVLLGRAPGAALRGCSLAVEEALA